MARLNKGKTIGNDSFQANRRLLDIYSGRRCLVTGHTGFKGAWLSLWLQMLGAKVTGYALDPPTEPNLFSLAGVGDLIEDIRGDIRDYKQVLSAVASAEPEVVFHLAAQPIVRLSYIEPKKTFDVNVGGTVNLLEALRHSPSIKSIVVITSDKCYENREWTYTYREIDHLGGHDPYSASKAGTEIICSAYERSFFRSKGVGLASCRAGNVIGGGDWACDRLIPDIVQAISADVAVKIRNPASIRPWQHVLEPLSGYLVLGARLFADANKEKQFNRFAGPWNFGPLIDSCCPVFKLADAFIDAYGAGFWEDASSIQADVPHEAEFLSLCWDKAYRFLEWHPKWDFRQTVLITSRWYREQASGGDAAKLCYNDIRSYMDI